MWLIFSHPAGKHTILSRPVGVLKQSILTSIYCQVDLDLASFLECC